MKKIILPWANRREVEMDVPGEVKREVGCVFVRSVREGVEQAFGRGGWLASGRRRHGELRREGKLGCSSMYFVYPPEHVQLPRFRCARIRIWLKEIRTLQRQTQARLHDSLATTSTQIAQTPVFSVTHLRCYSRFKIPYVSNRKL